MLSINSERLLNRALVAFYSAEILQQQPRWRCSWLHNGPKHTHNAAW